MAKSVQEMTKAEVYAECARLEANGDVMGAYELMKAWNFELRSLQ